MTMKEGLVVLVCVGVLAQGLYAPCVGIRKVLQESGHTIPWKTLLNPFGFIGQVKEIQRETQDDRLRRLIAFFYYGLIGDVLICAVLYWTHLRS